MDNARQRKKVALWAAGAVIAIAAVLAAVAVLNDPSDPVGTSPSPIVTSDGCAGVEGQSIDLDTQIVDAAPLTCFVLTEPSSVTIGAAALEPSDTIELTLRDGDGADLESAVSASDWDPEIALELAPGTYAIEVSGPDGDDVPPFLLYTATFVPQGGEQPDPERGVDTESVPTADACGTDVPLLADDSPVSFDPAESPNTADARFACVQVAESVFAKVGLASADPSDIASPDLTLAVYRVADGGEAELVRTADDAVGFDPETSLELEPGTYMVAASSWLGAETGPFEFYYDDDADLFRRGEPTSMHADLAPTACGGAPEITPGDTLTVEGDQTYVCLSVDQAQRLTIEAATLTDQDLVLEVLGYDDGAYRLAWADGDPSSDSLADFDPLVDQTVPPGTWVIAVTTYFGDPAAAYDLRVVAGGDT